MKYVHIKNGVVVATRNAPYEGHVEAPEEVECNWTFDGENYTAPDSERTRVISEHARQLIWDKVAPGETDAMEVAFKEVNLNARATKLTRKEARGQATLPETSELDGLQALMDYIEAVLLESARLRADVNLTLEDANWPTP